MVRERRNPNRRGSLQQPPPPVCVCVCVRVCVSVCVRVCVCVTCIGLTCTIANTHYFIHGSTLWPNCSIRTWQQSQLDLRQSKLTAVLSVSDPKVARKRQFNTSAQGSAVEHGQCRDGQRLKTAEDGLKL